VVTNADIHTCLGPEAARYAAHKHRGGQNGHKGTRYEDFFTACKVVEAVAWHAGDHPIATDFEYQMVLSRHCDEPAPHTTLVVSCATLADSLSAQIPATIHAHTSVAHFPWTETANQLVLVCADLREQLAELTHLESATHDVLSGTFGAILISCLQHPEGATVRELMAHASRMYPGQLRLLPPTEDWAQYLLPRFRQILDAIPGLRYGARRGFFHWEAFGTSGVFGSTVLSEEFRLFQRSILDTEPTTFEAFEEALP
jgi:hypothetical protein